MKKAALFLTLALAGSTCITAAAEEEMTDITMAFCTWTGYAPMFIAQENGFFEEQGLNVDIQVIEDESTYATLITQGSVQFLATAQDPNIKMFANGATSRYVLSMDASNGADGLVVTDEIQTMDDLAGKTLALDKSASSYYFFLTALENGSSLTEDDIKVMDMGDTTQAGLAFMSGSVDAAIMWEPELSEALESVEGAHTLVTSADYPDTILDSLVVNAKYAEEHPEVVEGVRKAWYASIEFMKENPEEAYKMMASGFEDVTAEDVASDVLGLEFFGEAENEELNDASAEESIFTISQKMADFWMEKGECQTDVLDDFFSLIK
ncbi:MAG: ABC transporter substrate-binding protein [Eubacteriales bacterium]|nr:ABC transporter substrate-binding protein [Eubacteriales bacterium]